MHSARAHDTLASLDAALATYMSERYGEEWRTMCHQSAKVATLALRKRFPRAGAELVRVELLALMKDSTRGVHIGSPDDTPKPGKYPMHWAVRMGSALYDPTFCQLQRSPTPLDLPETPFFYAPELLAAEHLVRGFYWAVCDRPTGQLQVGYKLQPAALPSEALAQLMPEGLAKRHADRVVSAWR